MANGHGGKRPGAGRRKLESTKYREALVKLAEKRGAELAQVLFDKALGGDISAIKEFNDRSLGKALQQIGGQGDDGEIIIKVVNHGGNDTAPVRAKVVPAADTSGEG